MDRVEAAFVVDAGWLGHTGVGRLTERFLTGAAELSPTGWTLWGPEGVGRFAWPDAHVVSTRHPPMARAAQRDLARVPPGDVVVSMHAVRPLAVWRPTVVYLHDTIPLRWDTPLRRATWRAFFTISAKTARAIVVNSRATADRAIADLNVAPARIHLGAPSVDQSLIARIVVARANSHAEPVLLYVGQIKPHKNLARAIQAFSMTAFARRGGRFAIVGGRRPVMSEPPCGVEFHPDVSDAQLVLWYARASAVILPSLEEGYGLPIVEALAAGIPVCCSDIPVLRESSQGLAEFVDPMSTSSIADGIDRATCALPPSVPILPTDREFAAAVIAAAG